MSISASIDIKLADNVQKYLTPAIVIQKLFEYGWTFNDDGQVSYLPLGDNDDYNWQRENLDSDSLMMILNEKEQNEEVIGIVLTWKDTNIGGQFLVLNEGTILINLTVNRKIMKCENTESEITDINWYITRLLPALNQDQTFVESFSYQEHV